MVHAVSGRPHGARNPCAHAAGAGRKTEEQSAIDRTTSDLRREVRVRERPYEPDDIEAALRRQPAQTCPSARQEPPPLPHQTFERTSVSRCMDTLDRCLSIFDQPARLIVWAFGQVCAWIAASVLAALCASLFVFMAVKSYPLWPVWFHRIGDDTPSRAPPASQSPCHRADHSLRQKARKL